MTADFLALYGLAVVIALTHTILGPDHYLPFIAMSRSGGWTLRKTIVVTVLCGIAHVLSSVMIGILGIALGVEVLKLETIESTRGALAGWLLLGFGLAYTIWGIRRSLQMRWQVPAEALPSSDTSAAPWILFTIFLFGPCEPLIPILMFPAAEANWATVAIVSAIFGLVTVGTMTVLVVSAVQSAKVTARVGGPWLSNFTQRYGHAIAGFTILVCGVAIKSGL